MKQPVKTVDSLFGFRSAQPPISGPNIRLAIWVFGGVINGKWLFKKKGTKTSNKIFMITDEINPNATGAKRDFGLKLRSRSGVANSHALDPI
jgi:hypothetical protein